MVRVSDIYSPRAVARSRLDWKVRLVVRGIKTPAAGSHPRYDA